MCCGIFSVRFCVFFPSAVRCIACAIDGAVSEECSDTYLQISCDILYTEIEELREDGF